MELYDDLASPTIRVQFLLHCQVPNVEVTSGTRGPLSSLIPSV